MENGEELDKRNGKEPESADFETAVAATGFGKYNLFLFAMAFMAALSAHTEASSLSFVFPIAKCDLDLTLEDIGLLNAVVYIGMMCSSLFWGYFSDTYGRKKIIVIGFFLDIIFVLMTAFAQNLTVILIAKFFGGAIISGPMATIPTYFSEFHGMKHRSRIPIIWGLLCNIAYFSLPLLGWVILNNNLRIFNLYSWNVFLLVCSFSTIISGIAYIFVPESPKFLMTSGNNEKAMTIFKRIYHWNTNKPEETFPITKLIVEKSPEKGAETQIGKLKQNLKQILPLFCPPLLPKFLLVCFLQLLTMMNTNTFKLWLPQIFNTFNEYEIVGKNQSTDICKILDLLQNPTNSADFCTTELDNTSTYTNVVWIQIGSCVGYIFGSFLITVVGKKKIIFLLEILAGLCICSVYFVNNTAAIIVLIGLNVVFTNVTVDVLLAVTIDLFPTTLRSSAVCTVLMTGRIGSITGNIIFPILLKTDCSVPFFVFGIAAISCAFVSLLLPNTDRKALE